MKRCAAVASVLLCLCLLLPRPAGALATLAEWHQVSNYDPAGNLIIEMTSWRSPNGDGYREAYGSGNPFGPVGSRYALHQLWYDDGTYSETIESDNYVTGESSSTTTWPSPPPPMP